MTNTSLLFRVVKVNIWSHFLFLDLHFGKLMNGINRSEQEVFDSVTINNMKNECG